MIPGIHVRHVGKLWWPFLPIWLAMRGREFTRDGYGHLVATEPNASFRTIWVYVRCR